LALEAAASVNTVGKQAQAMNDRVGTGPWQACKARGAAAVNGYTRSDGTYVQPYYRSSPDSSYNNNYEVKPNVNPYTGKSGTLPPTYDDRPPSRY
jgi:hypothetical protein